MDFCWSWSRFISCWSREGSLRFDPIEIRLVVENEPHRVLVSSPECFPPQPQHHEVRPLCLWFRRNGRGGACGFIWRRSCEPGEVAFANVDAKPPSIFLRDHLNGSVLPVGSEIRRL